MKASSEKPCYDLRQAQRMVRQGRLCETKKSTAWLRFHGYDPSVARRVLLQLRDEEFVRSLPPKREGGAWADVYRIDCADDELACELYLKFVVEAEQVVLMSCKEWGYSW